MLVSNILNDKGRDVVSVAPDTLIADASRTLAARKIGAVLVLQADGSIAGILSERDIVRALAKDGALALTRSVSAHMTRNVQSCEETDTVDELMEMMTRGRFRHMPVVRGGKLAGMISIGDVVKTRIAEAMREAEQLKEYIVAG